MFWVTDLDIYCLGNKETYSWYGFLAFDGLSNNVGKKGVLPIEHGSFLYQDKKEVTFD